MIRSVLGDSTVWSTARSVTRPWQINPERERNSLMNVVSNGSISFSTPCPEMMNNNNTYSTCALSLLSNSNPIHTPTNIWPPSSAFDDSITTDRVTMAHSPPVSIHHQYLNQTWEFLADEKSNSQFMSPVLGISHISEPADFQISNGTTMAGFELSDHNHQALRQYIEPEHTRTYHDSSPQHFNWSL